MEAAVYCEDLRKRFGDVVAVDGVHLEVRPAELLYLLGPSGCGKTTVLRLIAGLERLDGGVIRIAGREVAGRGRHVPPEQRQVGMVFQDYALFPHLTVAENVAYGLAGKPRQAVRQRVEELLRLVGLADLGDRRPQELSGGQQQRLALARALAPRPRVILLDEPFSSLDRGLRRYLQAEVHAILRRAGATAIFVTHDQEEALSMADRVAILWQGRLVQAGPPAEVYRNPATRQVAEFLGEANFLAGRAGGGRVACELGTFPAPPGAAGEVWALFRPEALDVARDDRGQARVVDTTFYGHDQLVRVRLPSGTALLVRAPGILHYAPGDRVRLTVRAAPVLYPVTADEADPGGTQPAEVQPPLR